MSVEAGKKVSAKRQKEKDEAGSNETVGSPHHTRRQILSPPFPFLYIYELSSPLTELK